MSTKNPRTVADEWQAFEGALESKVSPASINNLKMAFYSGVLCAFDLSNECGAEPVRAVAVDRLRALQTEVLEWMLQIQREAAALDKPVS